MKKYHINKHGIPSVCNHPIKLCPYGERNHFRTYEEAKRYSEKMNQAILGNVSFKPIEIAQSLRSYYLSGTAINEFPINRKVADLVDFDLMIISWLAINEVREGMKNNMIGKAKYTYGEIVKIIEEEVKLKTEFKDGLKLEEKYYNPIPFVHWEEQMKVQKNLYSEYVDELADELGFESMSIISLPMRARRLLAEDKFISNPENMNEVIYRVVPAVSQFGNIIAYNHSTKTISREFDVYEIAGVLESKTLFDLCYAKNLDAKFNGLWEKTKDKFEGVTYDEAKDRYKKGQFFKGVEGTSIPKAFIRMSPVAAKEIANFVSTHRAIMIAIGNMMTERGFEGQTLEEILREEDDDWIIEDK